MLIWERMTDEPHGDRAIKSPTRHLVTFERCHELDQDDPLARLQSKFRLPDNVIYLDGNSLGPLPKATPARIAEVSCLSHALLLVFRQIYKSCAIVS